eukprot:COSAG01_NODE_1141_length_11533_cov_588.596152_7_plen_101_part_00
MPPAPRSSSPTRSKYAAIADSPSGRLLWCPPPRAVPEHTVVGLPSLSPTMTAGTIASWTVEAGTEVGPGDVFCEIETDKATVDFECQDDGACSAAALQGL